MAPECMAGYACTEAVDIYSFGVRLPTLIAVLLPKFRGTRKPAMSFLTVCAYRQGRLKCHHEPKHEAPLV